MPIKMRLLYDTGKGRLISIANNLKVAYDLAFNAVDRIPPAYSCDKERIVVLLLSIKNEPSDKLRLFCKELTKARAQNVALIVDGNEAGAEAVKAVLKEAGTNVIDEVKYVKGGIPFLKSVKPEEMSDIKAWLDNALTQLK